MAIIQGNAKQGSTRGFYPKVINGSLRFNDDDSAYLSWTPASAGNRKTFTVSTWVKRANIADATFVSLGTTTGISLRFSGATLQSNILAVGSTTSSGVYRDPSAWYHIVLSVDTTQASNNDRLKLYVNGSEVSYSANASITQNSDLGANSTTAHYFGCEGRGGTPSSFFDGYLANVHFIDGQALTASDFGETKNGVWVAKDYAGTFGTNGFYLTFEDDTQVEAFNTVLYRGATTGTESQIVTGTGFTPDLVWIKNRGTTNSHRLFDSVRGTGNYLETSGTSAEASDTGNGTLTSFDSDGFTLQGGSTNANPLCESGNNYVAWCWKAGDSNVSNTDGTITSTVRANDTYGFSIVSYNSGTASSSTIGHGLSSTPDFIILKRRVTGNWIVWHSGVCNSTDDYLELNSTGGLLSTSGVWGSTVPTSSVFSHNTGITVGTNEDVIAYCWSETTGYSKFGSYVGSSGDPTVTTGFKPAFVLIKRTDAAGNSWSIWDNTRDTDGDGNLDLPLFPNLSNAEDTTSYTDYIQFTDTGFVVKGNGAFVNGGTSSYEYIYAAFADTREAAFWLDQSGNDNDWQPVNLDHNDTVTDSPTNNFCTMLGNYYVNTGTNAAINLTLSNGNLDFTGTSGSNQDGRGIGSMGISSGKFYWEVTVVANNVYMGITRYTDMTGGAGARNKTGDITYNDSNGYKYKDGTGSSYGDSFGAGDVIGIALDMDVGQITFYKNGVSQGVAYNSGLSGYTWFPLISTGAGTTHKGSVNFGQQPFKYDPPA